MDDDPGADPAPVVAVTRTGGIAGIPRRWRATPGVDDRARWRELIARCPWDDLTPDAPGPAPAPDRFTWVILVLSDDEVEHAARLPDVELTGAWRALVDAVRDWSPSR